jgi:hypothetical protein
MRSFIDLVESFQILSERKMDIVDVLAKYKNDPDVFFQFSNIEKVGINPSYKFDITPLGIYGYPVKSIWEDILVHRFKFAQERKYIHVFRLKPGFNILYVDQYTASNFRNDMTKLKKIFDKIENNSSLPEHFFAKELRAKSMPWKENDNEFIVDDNILNRQYVKQLLDKTKFVGQFERNLIRLKSNSYRSYSLGWNAVLRSLGYDGIVDTGYGQITSDIPAQAVFFSIKPIQVIETSYNAMKHDNVDIDKASDDLKQSIKMKHGKEALEINYLPEKEQFKLIVDNPILLRFLKNPSPKLQLKLVKSSLYFIRNIRNPCLEVQRYVADKNFNLYYRRLSPKVIIEKINENPKILKDMDLPKNLEIALVKYNPDYIQYMKNTSTEAQLCAIRKNPKVYNRIENPSEKTTKLYNELKKM